MPSSALANQEDAIDWLDVLLTLAQHLRTIVLLPLMVSLLALAWTFTFEPGYKAITRFLPPPQQSSAASAMLQSLGNLGSIAGAAAGIKNPGDQHVSFLKSQRVQYDLIDRFKLLQLFETDDKEFARTRLAEMVTVANGLDGVITVTVVDGDPRRAADLANGHVEAFRRLLAGMAVTEAQQRRIFFEKQLLLAKDNLIRAEQDLKRSGVAPDSLKANPVSAVDVVARLRASIAAQEIKLRAMQGYLTDLSPEVRAAQAELRALRQQLADQGQQTDEGKVSSSDYLARYRNFKYQETLFEIISKQYEIARVDESREGSVIQVLDVAVPARHRMSAHRIQITSVAASAALLFVVACLLVRRSLQRVQRTPEGVSKMKELRHAVRQAAGLAR